ncbi:hypothetical protein DFH09DRAFT_1197334, partial [Mycena vulgaris]
MRRKATHMHSRFQRLPCLSTARAFNANFAPSYTPVAILFGSTSGIGRGMAEAFARHTKGNAQIFLLVPNHAATGALSPSSQANTQSKCRKCHLLLWVICTSKLVKSRNFKITLPPRIIQVLCRKIHCHFKQPRVCLKLIHNEVLGWFLVSSSCPIHNPHHPFQAYERVQTLHMAPASLHSTTGQPHETLILSGRRSSSVRPEHDAHRAGRRQCG